MITYPDKFSAGARSDSSNTATRMPFVPPNHKPQVNSMITIENFRTILDCRERERRPHQSHLVVIGIVVLGGIGAFAVGATCASSSVVGMSKKTERTRKNLPFLLFA
jgi:hypothetical protein